MGKRIDLAAIDRESFNVSKRGDRFLITPSKSKHVWLDGELHLRSLLVDENGRVLSSGFPKFRNYGEDEVDDAEFRLALARGAVHFTEKMDGSLIIADVIDGKAHFRTRGNDTLGDFHEPVMALIRERYPMLIPALESQAFWIEDCSLLFEYTAPDNRIVIRYPEASLTYLAAIDKATLTPFWDLATTNVIVAMTGVPSVRYHLLPTEPGALVAAVNQWWDKEGVVARFVRADGSRGMQVKIKASQYVKLHALKFKLEGNVGKLLYLLGAREVPEARHRLYDLGVDYEAQHFIEQEMFEYLYGLRMLEHDWGEFTQQLNEINRAQNECLPEKEHRKQFVEMVRREIAEGDWPQEFFGAAMKLYDGAHEEADLLVYSRLLLNEAPQVVRHWRVNPQAAVTDILNVRVSED
jgi:hypothetical protein